MADKPNILLIVTDDQRFDTIGALGNSEIQTPNLDRLVRRGTCMTRAHIPGGTCGAVCMPSRAMLLTGRTLFHLQGEGQAIPTRHILLGEALKAQDYSCYGIGKWHNGPESFNRCFADGESIFFGGMWDHWNVPICSYDRTGRYDNVIPFISHFQQSNVATPVHCDRIVPGRHSSELLTDTAIAFLEQADAGQPFFLYTAYLAPHDPRSMPARYRALYDPQQLTLPDNVLPDHPFDFGVAGIRDELLTARPRDEQTTRCQLADYYAMISHLDHEIGRILDTLERQGRLEQTIIVLAGDNGLAVGCHGLMGKQNLYEHSVRVPLLLAGPGIPADVRCAALVYLLDLYPTLFELLGLPIPSSVEGQSFAAALADPALPHRQRLYLAYADLIRAVRDERFKLIEYRGVARQTQLFDLVKDPAECRNLADDPRYTPVRDHLRAALLEMAQDWDDAQHPVGQRFWRAYRQAELDCVRAGI